MKALTAIALIAALSACAMTEQEKRYQYSLELAQYRAECGERGLTEGDILKRCMLQKELAVAQKREADARRSREMWAGINNAFQAQQAEEARQQAANEAAFRNRPPSFYHAMPTGNGGYMLHGY